MVTSSTHSYRARAQTQTHADTQGRLTRAHTKAGINTDTHTDLDRPVRPWMTHHVHAVTWFSTQLDPGHMVMLGLQYYCRG